MSHKKINEVLQPSAPTPTATEAAKAEAAKSLASFQLRSHIEDMFQPTPTPYATTFSLYGAANPIVDFRTFQPVGGSLSDATGPPVFRTPAMFTPINPNANTSGPYSSNDSLNQQQQYKMAANDLEEQEALAREFRPVLEGPRVGPKKSCQVIAEDYAKADPIYITKTAGLSRKYSHFRPLLGDGNCGWRAVGFSYFEALLRQGNKSQFDAEVARMTSLNNFLSTVGGFEAWVFEDMVDETISLLKSMAASVYSPDIAMEMLLRRFNDESVESAIIYHLRLLASSWLKSNSAQYSGFIPVELGQGELAVVGYCKEILEAPNQEIDHLGMTLLIDTLMKPIGITVEVVYLDRSEGDQVNSHIFEATNPIGSIVHLLYRPSHYDILYKDDPSIALQPIGEPVQPSNIQVNRASNFSQHHLVQSTPSMMNGFSELDLTGLLSIPGFCPAPPPSHHGFPAHYSPIEQTYAGSPISASPVSPGPSPVANSSTAGLTLSTSFPQQTPTLTSAVLSTSHSPFPATTQLPIHSLPREQPIRPSPTSRPSLSSHPSELSSPVLASSSFRPSKYEWEAAADWQEGPVVFQTSTFKNSHYNTAHYNNPNFQPEEWSPDWEEGGGSGSRKRST